MEATTKFELNMTPKEKASLAFSILSEVFDDNEETDIKAIDHEINRLHSTCKQKTYIAHDIDFSERVERLKKTCLILGRDYWQARAFLFFCLFEADKEESKIKDEVFELIGDYAIAKLSGVLTAIDEMTERQGITRDAFLKVSGIPEEEPIHDFCLNHENELKAKQLERYRALIDFY